MTGPELVGAYKEGKLAYHTRYAMPAGWSGPLADAWTKGWRVAEVIDRAHRIARAYRATAETTGVS